jgi:hypothetical protein
MGDVDSLHVEIDDINDLLVGFYFIKNIDLHRRARYQQFSIRSVKVNATTSELYVTTRSVYLFFLLSLCGTLENYRSPSSDNLCANKKFMTRDPCFPGSQPEQLACRSAWNADTNTKSGVRLSFFLL